MADVKFCGITRPGDARLAAELGARYVGLIFAKSRRQVSAERGAELAAVARPAGAWTVGVFADMAPEDIASTAKSVHLDAVQLHDVTDPEVVRRLRLSLGVEVWAVAHVGPSGLPPGHVELADAADALVLDTWSSGALGGTGEQFDWSGVRGAVAALRARTRLVVAGGLRADNVGAAIDALDPDVVDVSSGIEAAPGIKDPEKMRAFMTAVRQRNSR